LTLALSTLCTSEESMTVTISGTTGIAGVDGSATPAVGVYSTISGSNTSVGAWS
jgi:hypothetical protein